jgi:hypothetical protein
MSLTARQHNATLQAVRLGAQAGQSSLLATRKGLGASGTCGSVRGLFGPIDAFLSQLLPSLADLVTQDSKSAAGASNMFGAMQYREE